MIGTLLYGGSKREIQAVNFLFCHSITDYYRFIDIIPYKSREDYRLLSYDPTPTKESDLSWVFCDFINWFYPFGTNDHLPSSFSIIDSIIILSSLQLLSFGFCPQVRNTTYQLLQALFLLRFSLRSSRTFYRTLPILRVTCSAPNEHRRIA